MNTVCTTAYILRCRLHITCPHSVSQNGTCGGADGPDEKGRWHLEHVTNSQISRSVDEEDEIWDMPWGYGRDRSPTWDDHILSRDHILVSLCALCHPIKSKTGRTVHQATLERQ